MNSPVAEPYDEANQRAPSPRAPRLRPRRGTHSINAMVLASGSILADFENLRVEEGRIDDRAGKGRRLHRTVNAPVRCPGALASSMTPARPLAAASAASRLGMRSPSPASSNCSSSQVRPETRPAPLVVRSTPPSCIEHQASVTAGLNVQLDIVAAQRDPSADGGEGVFRGVAGGAAMADPENPPCCRSASGVGEWGFSKAGQIPPSNAKSPCGKCWAAHRRPSPFGVYKCIQERITAPSRKFYENQVTLCAPETSNG